MKADLFYMKAQLPAIRMLPGQTILSVWREQLAQATPGLSQTLLGQQTELLPRFAAYYSRLACMPRRVRRQLQRQMGRAGFNPLISGDSAAPRPHEFGRTLSDRKRGADFSVTPLAPLSRSLRRQWKRSLAGVALLLALGQAPALAATINVGGGCRLVDAITAANTDNAIGRCRAGRGADTIVLPANSTHTLTQVNNGYVGPSGLPVVTSTITIAGNGSTIARSQAPGTPAFRIFIVGRINAPSGQHGNLTLQQTKVTGGSLPGDSRGGGVYRRSGSLTLDRCTIAGNQAYLGGGVANAAAGTLTVTNSTISGNTATGNQGGGGVFNNGHVVNTDPGVLIVTYSTTSGNTAKFGGGMRNDGIGSLTNSTISGNKADTDGAGVANRASLTISDSTVSGNDARGSGGGVWSSQGAANSQATVTVTNSTVSKNFGSNRGGGLYNSFGRMSLTNSTVTQNFTSSQGRGGGVFSGGRVGNLRSDVILNRTLISANTALLGNEIFQEEGGVVTANNFNLFGHSARANAQLLSGFILSGGSDITASSDGSRPTAAQSILSAAPANNGGPTQTWALVPGSPAIDAVATGCPLQKTDQRGVLRPQDGNNDGIALCDIGAFERAP